MRMVSPRFDRLLMLLLLTDFVFILINLLARAFPSVLSSKELLLSCERGHAEIYQYVKWLWMTLLMGFYLLERRRLIYFTWMGVFFFLLLDDSMRVHETVGLWLSRHAALPELGSMRPRDMGELLVSVAIGVTLVGLACAAALWGTARERLMTLVFVGLMAALAMCGIVADAMHVLFSHSYFTYVFYETLEDGGELLVASIALGVVYHLDPIMDWVEAKAADVPLLTRILLSGPSSHSLDAGSA